MIIKHYKPIIKLLLLFIGLNLYSITLNVKNYGASGNGMTDDTNAFQKCVDVLSSKGGGEMLVPAGNYAISHLTFFGKKYSNISVMGENSTISQLIEGKRKSAVDGKFSTFALRNAADGCFVFDAQVSMQKDDRNSIKNIKLTGLNFKSNVGKYGFDELLHQISAHGVSNFTIENCTFTGFLGDGIAINGGTDFSRFHDAYNKNVSILNCKFDGINKNNRQGICIYYSDSFTIDHCDFKNITRQDMPGAIDIEPDREINVLRNGIISNCTFNNIGGTAAILFTQKKLLQDKIVDISNCIFTQVKSPLAVLGNFNYLNSYGKSYALTMENCTVNNSESVADLREAYGIYFKAVNFYNIKTQTYNTVSGTGVNNVKFENCFFDGVLNIDGLSFTGQAKNIDFIGCTFKNFKKQAITINDPAGLGNISFNNFVSTATAKSFPVLTRAGAKRIILKQIISQGNLSSGNFLNFTLAPFYTN